jgi:uncharacterized protein (DUF1330 family)
MPVYLIANVKLTDNAWVPEYDARVHDIAARHGGRYLSRSANIRTIEGPAPDADVIALIEFPSFEAVEAFAGDPEYAPLRPGAAGRQRKRPPRHRRQRRHRRHPLPAEGRRLTWPFIAVSGRSR